MAERPAKLKKLENRGLFDEEGPEQTSLFSRAIPGFYSQLERTIESKMPSRALPSQIRAILDNPQNATKLDERNWTGIDDFIADQKGPISKQQVLKYLKANEVRVEEVAHGHDPETGRSEKDATEALRVAMDRCRKLAKEIRAVSQRQPH